MNRPTAPTGGAVDERLPVPSTSSCTVIHNAPTASSSDPMQIARTGE